LPLIGGLLVTSITSGRLIARTGHYKAYPVAGTALAAAADSTRGKFYTIADADKLLANLPAGRRVPIRNLLRRMITRSSNLATNELISLVGAKNVTAMAQAIGWSTASFISPSIRST